MKTRLIFLFILFQYVTQLYAQVSLPAFFTDNMVLQRNTVIPVWGRAAANEKIELKFHQQTKTVKADINGRWMARLDAETAGGPFELFIKGNNSILLKNILVGDVWLCSGQSNMEWTVGQSDNAAKEMRGANNPFIRHIKIQHQIRSLPAEDVSTAGWKICDSISVADFTGVGYFFWNHCKSG